MIDQLLQDMLAFLEQPEYEIVSVYSEDGQKESIYCGLALAWEQERDALMSRIREAISPRLELPRESEVA